MGINPRITAAKVLFRLLIVMSWLLGPQTVAAAGQNPAPVGEAYVPTIWVDPDGCEHWVFDDGAEGYMSPHLQRDGRPVCRTGNTCAVLATDQMFATNQFRISGANRNRLIQFFQSADAKSFIITGHTDDRASDAYNMSLSQRRADAVAQAAKDAGVVLFDVRGYGERMPRASNRTAAGRAQNRRVEIICMH